MKVDVKRLWEILSKMLTITVLYCMTSAAPAEARSRCVTGPDSLAAAAPASSRVDLTWSNNSSRYNNINVQRSADGVSFATIATVGSSATSYTDKSVAAATAYHYRVFDSRDCSSSYYSNVAYITTPTGGTACNAPPASLAALAASANRIDLAWKNAASNYTNITVQRSIDKVNFTTVATLGPTASAYSDATAAPATTYYYRVFDPSDCSSTYYSNVAGATTPSVVSVCSLPPAGLSAIAISASQVNLGWQNSSTNYSTITIQRSTDNVNFTTVASVGATATSYVDANVAAETTYYYRVYDPSDCASAYYSNIAIVNTPSATTCNAAPSKLTATAAFATEITLRWENKASYQNVVIERSTDNIKFASIASLPGSATRYTDAAVAPRSGYQYRLHAPEACATPAYSNVASATTTIDLITDPNAVFPEPSVAKPAYLTAWTDPVFKTKITRIAGNPGSAFSTLSGSGVWSKDARHNYQLVQPWSNDGAIYAMENRTDGGGVNGGGGGSSLYLDGETYRPKYSPPSNSPGDDERWNSNASYSGNMVMADKSTAKLWWFDIGRNSITRSWSLPFTPRYIGNTKGHVSRDGRFVVMLDTTLTKMAVVDMDPKAPYAAYPSQRIGPVYNIEGTIGGVKYTNPTMAVDPSGKYVVLHYSYKNGVGGDYMRVYDIDPATLALSVHPMPGAPQCVGGASENWIYSLGHHDLALNPFDDDEPVAIGQEECDKVGRSVTGVKTVNSNGVGHVVMVRLRDGAVTSLTDPGNGGSIAYEAYAHHVSARNLALPGWVFVSYGPWSGQQKYRFYDEVVAVSMDGKQRVQRLAHLHSDFENFTGNGCTSSDSDFDYRSESHSVPSPDGKRVAFASNWIINGAGTGGCSIQDYVIDLRP